MVWEGCSAEWWRKEEMYIERGVPVCKGVVMWVGEWERWNRVPGGGKGCQCVSVRVSACQCVRCQVRVSGGQ